MKTAIGIFIRVALAVAFLGLVASANAEEWTISNGAVLTFPDAGLSIAPGGALKGWRHPFEPKGRVNKTPDGGYAFSMVAGEILPTGERAPTAVVFSGEMRLEPKDDGSLRLSCSITPDRDIELETLHLGVTAAAEFYGGGTIAGDGENPVTIPETMSREAIFFSRTVKEAMVVDRLGKHRLSIALDSSSPVTMQDNRKWGIWNFTLRLPFGSCSLKAGERSSLAIVLRASKPMVRSETEGCYVTKKSEKWIELKEDAEIVADSALDFSKFRRTGQPAGCHGMPKVVGDHFEFEAMPGVRQRFWGVNVCMRAVAPEPEIARRFAVRLARLGYNAVRLHHHESQIVAGDGRGLDPEKMARFDALVAACVENGIYLTTDLFASRQPIPYRSIGIEREGSVPVNDYKELVLFHEGAFNELKRWSREFLCHENQITGRSLAEEPALLMITLVNEGSAGNRGMSIMSKYPEARELYKGWLSRMNKEFPDRFKDVSDTLPTTLNDRESAHQAAFTLFLSDLETRFIRRMRHFLREELGVHAAICDMNGWHVPVSHMRVKGLEGDCVDDHFYVDHPQWVEKPWRLPSKSTCVNPVMTPSMGAWELAIQRSLDKPMAVTEFGYPAPNPYRNASGLLSGAMAALQDWSALWHFAWAHDEAGLAAPESKRMDFFNLCGDPLTVAAARAGTCLFLREDLKPLTETYAIRIGKSRRDDDPRDGWLWHTVPWSWAAWYAKVGFTVRLDTCAKWVFDAPEVYSRTSAEVRRDIFGAANASLPYKAGGGGIRVDPSKGAFMVLTPGTAGGFSNDGVIPAGAVSAKTTNGESAAVWASSLDGKALGRSSRVLVTHLTDLRNTAQRFADARSTVLLDWGHTPHLIRAGIAEVSIAMPRGKWRVYALSTGGRRLRDIPYDWRDGRLIFKADIAADPEAATFLYEITASQTDDNK